jgi:hypothetical protein
VIKAEWLIGDNLSPLLVALRGQASERKLRLFACACCRRIWGEIPGDLNRRAVEAVEEHPQLSREQFPDVFSHPVLSDALRASSSVEHEHFRSTAYWAVKYLGRTYYKLTPFDCALIAAHHAAKCANAARPGGQEEAAQAALLRCLFGDPDRPAAADPRWVTPLAVSLATAAYDRRALPSGELDAAILSVLGDALEDAGCTDDDLLGHLRSPGPHVLGCRAVDLVLGLD